MTLAWLLAAAPAAAAPGNLIAGLKPSRVEGVRNASVLTDGYRAHDGDDWNTSLTAVFASGRSYVEYDLGKSTNFAAAYLQGDNNDRYALTISDDGKNFREIWACMPVDRAGLQPRSSMALRGTARYLRVSARDGDGSYSLSEVQVFAEQPTPFPPKIPTRGGTTQAPRLRTSLLIFALAWAAFLFATDKRSGKLWLGIAAVAPLAAGFALYTALSEGWPPGLREVSLARAVSAAIAVLALLRAAAFRIRFPANKLPLIAALSTSAVLAFASFYNLGHPQFWNAKKAEPEFVHTWDMRVYYPFAKYFEEIGYDGVYLASVAAYVEDVPGMTVEAIGHTEIRNLKTHKMQRVSDVASEIKDVHKRFTKERWDEFRADMTYFREVMGSQYLPTHHDHGSNATPVWVVFAKALFSGRPATEAVLTIGGLVDVFLILGAFAAMWWAYGVAPALLAMVVFGANDFYMFGTNWGGATLRHDWLAYIAFGLCALKKQRWAVGGAFFGLSTMIRAFPGATLIGVVLPALWWTFERWGSKDERPTLKAILEKHRPAVLVLVGAAGCMVGTFLLSSALLGFDAWVVWWKKIILLNADVGLNDISLKSLVAGNDNSITSTLNHRVLLYWAAFVASISAVAYACRARPLDQAAMLALPLIPLLTNPANYYQHFIFVLPLLGTTLQRAAKRAKERGKERALEESIAPVRAESLPPEATATEVTAGEAAKSLEAEAGEAPVSKPEASDASPGDASPGDVKGADTDAPRESKPKETEPARRAIEKRRVRAANDVVPLKLPHLAISGPLLALCIAQYWTVLDPDIERHFQGATALFFAAMGWIYVRVLREDGLFDTGPDAPPPTV